MGYDATAIADEARAKAVDDLVATGAIAVAFQPIVDLRAASIAGYEALMRPDPASPFADVGSLIDAAERCGRLADVERLARRKAMAVAGTNRQRGLLFLNNSPRVLSAPGYVETIEAEIEATPGVSAHDIVLEITERTDHGMHREIIARSIDLRERGFCIAIDDVGAGISGLNQIMALRPNWIKLDIELISNIDYDPLKQNLIRFFVHFAKLGNMKLIAEGIERFEELRVLIELGVAYGQGFLLGRAGAWGEDLAPQVREGIDDAQARASTLRHLDPGSVRVGALVHPVIQCDIEDDLDAAAARLAEQAEQPGAVVLNGRRYVGWIEREEVLGLRTPTAPRGRVGTLPAYAAPLVGPNLALTEALEIVAAQPEGLETLPLVVQAEGAVIGIVPLRRLLQAAAEAHRRAPSHIAPLTGLPSRVQADRWLAAQIRLRSTTNIAIVDLRGFDAYNIAYGFEKGDEMLVRLVGLLKSRLVDVADGAEFLAHLGEDRFMLAFPSSSERRLRALMREFREIRAEFFSAVDLSSGTFTSSDASGCAKSIPLTTLRVIYLPQVLTQVTEPREVHFIARRLSLRSFDGTSTETDEIVVDRRADAARLRLASAC